MENRTRDTSYKRGRGILVIVIIGLLIFSICSQSGQKKDMYELILADRSGQCQNKDESDDQESGTTDQNEGQTVNLNSVDTEMIRVLLYQTDYTSIFHENLMLRGKDGEVTIDADQLEHSFTELREKLSENGIVLDVCQKEKQKQVYDISMQDGSAIEVLSIRRSCGYPVYRGKLTLYPEDGKLVIVNELPFEEYLYSVIPSEMPASYEEEALKAQAVCARTYAGHFFYIEKYPQYHACLDDSTSCQVYGNQSEDPRTTRAVNQTEGMILWNGKQPAETFYYSTSCGLSADIGVWPDYEVQEFPYLQARALNENHEEVDFSDDPTGVRFYTYLTNAQGDHEETLVWYRWCATVEPLQVSLIYQKMSERYRVKPEQILCYEDGRLTTKTPEEFHEIKDISVVKRGKGGSVLEISMVTDTAEYRIYGEYNIRYVLCDGQTQVIKADGSSQIMSSILPSSFFILTPILDKGLVIGYSVSGGGYGHGVGMSQNGADIMAQNGKKYDQILAYYYPGTVLSSIH